jgi:hypothetical protein
MKVPAEKLRAVLGVSEINFARPRHTLALVDSSLEANSEPSTPSEKESKQ